MELFASEVKKMMIKRRGLPLIVLFFLLQLGFLFLTDTPVNENMEACRKDYIYYLSGIEGRLTEETTVFIEDISKQMREASLEIPRLYNSFYDRNITKKELEIQAAPYEEVQRHKNGFNLLYEQFIYARENPENRYLLYDNGWNALLTCDTFNIVFVALLLLTITPIFCQEYYSGMDVLNLTTQKGVGRLTLAKLLLVIVIVTLLCFLNGALEYCFYGLRYGLPHGDYPLQSLSYFGESTKVLTLLEAFLWIAASRWFGSIMFAVIILFLSVLTKKYTLTLVLSTALLIVPYYAVPNETIWYILPVPLAFMLAVGFLRGTETMTNSFTQQETVLFHEITVDMLSVLIGLMLILMAVMIYVIFQKTSSTWRGKRAWFGKRCRTAALLSLVLLVSMTGCAGEVSGDTRYDIYNIVHRTQFENERYKIWVDVDAETILFEDKKTEQRERLVRDPLQLSSTIGQCLYGNGRYVYYFRNVYNKSGRYDGVERVSLIEVDTETFQERIVYENTQSSLDQVFLGSGINSLFDAANQQGIPTFLENVWAFFICGHTLYLLDNNVRTIDLYTGHMNMLDIPSPSKGSLAFDGRIIYYTTDQLQVEAYDTKTREAAVIPNLITEFFFLTDTHFIYINRTDEYRLYAMNREDGMIAKLTDRSVLWFEVNSESIYYIDRFDKKSYRINQGGENETLVKEFDD